MADRKIKAKGSQGIGETQVAYLLGKNCPTGREKEAEAGLAVQWPDLHERPEAIKAFRKGLQDRSK